MAKPTEIEGILWGNPTNTETLKTATLTLEKRNAELAARVGAAEAKLQDFEQKLLTLLEGLGK